MQWANISAILYGLGIFCTKISILLQYLRIFAPTRQGNMIMYVGAHVCIWMNLVFYSITTVFYITICSPRAKIYDPLVTTGHCFNTAATFKATGVFNILSDFALLVLPLQSIWKLRRPLRRKILINVVFATGVL